MSCDKSWNESNVESNEQKDNERTRKMSARNTNAQQTQQHLAASSKFNLSAKEFVSRASAHTSPSSLAPAMTGLNMMPSPTFTSQSWIVDNLRSLISNQDDDAGESESEMASLHGPKAYKAKTARSPMHSIGNFEIDEIEQARRDRFEGRASQMQYQSQSAFRSASGGQGKDFRSFGGMRNDEDYENQNAMEYSFESSGAYFEERFPPKRPFSPDEIHELTPYQQLQYQIQQQQQHNNLLFKKSQQSKEKGTMRPSMNESESYFFQNADGLDCDNDVGMLNDFNRGGGQFGPSCFGDISGFDNSQMRKNMFRSSSSSKLLPNKSNVVRLNERKQRSLMRLTSEMPTGLGVGQMEPMNHHNHSFQSSGRLPNKSPSDNNLLAYFKQFNQPSSVSEQFSHSRGASFACPNIFVSQASSGLGGSMGEFVPKSARFEAQMNGGSKMLKVDSAEMAHSRRHEFNMDGSNDFNNSSMCEFDAQQSECSFNGSSAFASRRNYPQFLSQRMQSSRHSLQMSDLRAHQMSLQQSQPRYSMVSQHLDPESAFGVQGQQHGLKKMAKSSSSLVYQENQSFSGINSRYGHMNDSEMSFMSMGGNQDDSLLAHHPSQKWMNNGGGKKWMLNQVAQQQFQMQQQQHQLMSQQAANGNREGFRSGMLIEDEEGQSQGQDQKEPIILHVKNLDYKISADEWKRILLENFRKHCKEIISVSVATNADKSLLGIVKLGTKEDTRLAISCLHHKKIGYKRLNVEIASSSGSNSSKSKVVALLKSSGDNSEMPLTRFIETFESRYNQTITIAELFKLKDTVYISHGRDGQGRQIKLIGNKNQYNLENEMQELLHTPYCSLHSSQKHDEFSMRDVALSKGEGFGWLPNVIVSLRTFKSAVHKLLNDHGGQMSLLSFMDCYRCCIYNDAAAGNNGSSAHKAESCDHDSGHLSYQLVIDNENGVPLEHLITCAQDVQIQLNEGFYKQLQWENDKTKSVNLQSRNNNSASNLSALLNSTSNKGRLGAYDLIGGGFGDQMDDSMEESQRKLNLFSHEVVELFKNVPRCVIPLSKFNTEYNKKYGRQCRVADYGYTKLYELLESIPHILQVLGSEYEKKLTLTHRIQVRRFSNDLLKVLKAHPTKQMFADEYPSAYEKHFGKAFDIRDYGVCFLEDMLAELPDTIVCRKEVEGRTFIQIPRVVQLEEEALCTKRLANDIIDMLKHKPRFSIQFNKFIPNYHHHFGRQCKLSNYGFTKLIELLEAMPNVVQLLVKDSLQFVQLKQPLMIDVICQNIVKLIEDSSNEQTLVITLGELEELYNSKYEPIYYMDFECRSFIEFFKTLPFEKHFIKLSAELSDERGEETDLLADREAFLTKATDESSDSSLEITLHVEAINENMVKRVGKLVLKRLIDDEMDNYLANHLQANAAVNKSLISFDEMIQLLFYANTTSQSEIDCANVKSKIEQLNKREYHQLMRLLSEYLQIMGPNQSDSNELPPSSQASIIGFSDVYYFCKQIRIIYKQISVLEMTFSDLEMVYKQAMSKITGSQSNALNGFPCKRLGFIDTHLLFSQGISLLVSVKKFDNDKVIVLNKEFWPKVFDSARINFADSFSPPLSPIDISLNPKSIPNGRVIKSSNSNGHIQSEKSSSEPQDKTTSSPLTSESS